MIFFSYFAISVTVTVNLSNTGSPPSVSPWPPQLATCSWVDRSIDLSRLILSDRTPRLRCCWLQVSVDHIRFPATSSTRLQPAALRLRGRLADGATWTKQRRVQGSVSAVLCVASSTSWTTLQRTVALRFPLSGERETPPPPPYAVTAAAVIVVITVMFIFLTYPIIICHY